MLERLHKRTRPISWYGERLKRDGGHAYITSAVFALPRLPKDRVAIGGASFQPEYLKQAFFPQMLDALIAYKLGEDGGNPLAMAVYAADGHAESNTSMG